MVENPPYLLHKDAFLFMILNYDELNRGMHETANIISSCQSPQNLVGAVSPGFIKLWDTIPIDVYFYWFFQYESSDFYISDCCCSRINHCNWCQRTSYRKSDTGLWAKQ